MTIPTLVVVQPTPYCNISCKYCYLTNRDDMRRISFETLERIVESIFSSDLVVPPITFVWHAGEPLSIGKAFYEYAFSLIKKLAAHSSKPFSHSIQTNGLLLDPTWLELFRQYNVRIGLSIDGPGFLHDANRRTRNNRGTFDLVLARTELLKNNNYPFDVISVITYNHLQHADVVFKFFLNLGINSLGLNIEETEGSNIHSSLDAVPIEKIKAFLRRLIQLQDESDGQIQIREFINLHKIMKFGTASTFDSIEIKSMSATPFRIFSFDIDGNVSTFCPELLGINIPIYGKFIMGNINECSLDEIKKNDIFQRALHDISMGLNRCRNECEYWKLCGGGSPSNKMFEHKTFDVSETQYCKIHKKAVIDSFIEEYESRVLFLDDRCE